MFCKNCGGKVGESQPFCVFCGVRLTPGAVLAEPRSRVIFAEPDPEVWEELRKRKHAETRIKAALLAFVLLVLCVGFYEEYEVPPGCSSQFTIDRLKHILVDQFKFPSNIQFAYIRTNQGGPFSKHFECDAVVEGDLSQVSVELRELRGVHYTSDIAEDTHRHYVTARLFPMLTEQDVQQNSSPPNPTPNPPPTQANVPPVYATDQSFSVGYWTYLCHAAFWTPVLGFDPYSMERANSTFIVVDITARNDDTSPSTLPPFQLVDGDGRTYGQSSAGMLSQGFFSGLEQLNPGVSKRGRIAFDVPPDRQYVLAVSGGIESGLKAIVLLPMSAPRPDKQSPESTQ
jgi:hypothetical protein